MQRHFDIAITALAPLIWGSTYFVTTEFLPPNYPITMAALRALPAGLLLLVFARQLPTGIWWARILLLGAFNFTFFWTLLFIAAYRLPGGVAATVGAVQPFMVIFLARAFLGSAIRITGIMSSLSGMAGVGILVLGSQSLLDPIGIVAGLGGAASMAMGIVLTRKWQPPVSLLTFTAWQLTAGGLLLVPIAIMVEPPLPDLKTANIFGIAYLCIVGGALTYIFWFRGISRMAPSVVSLLGFLSPLAATILGWGLLGQALSVWQLAGMTIILFAVWRGQQKGNVPDTKSFTIISQRISP